jgi:Zn-dependent membrane protease YugP
MRDFQQQIARLRRRQVASVAVGSVASILLLLGLAWQWRMLFWPGVVLFVTALLAIFYFGAWAVLYERRATSGSAIPVETSSETRRQSDRQTV